MSEAIEFDAERFLLGNICIHGHDFFGTGRSIRYRHDNKCVDCRVKGKPYLTPVVDRPLGFDESKLYLGKLCPKRHEWKDSGFSLRRKRNGENAGDCVECKKESFAKNYKPHPKAAKRSNVIDDKFYLGDLCGSGCDYQQTGKSLRYLTNGGCAECNRARSASAEHRENTQRWRQSNKQHIANYNKRYRKSQSGIRIPVSVPVPDFDQAKYYLGRVCKRKHDWQNTGGSLRSRWGGRCMDCLKEWQIAQRKPPRRKIRIVIASKYYLGSLCHKGHDYDNTGKSLKYLSSDTCVACTEEYNAEYCEVNKERLLKQKRDYCRQNRDRLVERQRQRYWENREECLRRASEWRKSDRGKKIMRICHQRRRARKAQNHSAYYTLEDRQQHFEKFNNCCAYCGRAEKLEVDHFIAVSQGGSDCLGNILPACCRCNKSKNNSHAEEWYKRQSFYSVKRWRQILKVLGKSDSSCDQLPLI